jgi:hypothetical protein
MQEQQGPLIPDQLDKAAGRAVLDARICFSFGHFKKSQEPKGAYFTNVKSENTIAPPKHC